MKVNAVIFNVCIKRACMGERINGMSRMNDRKVIYFIVFIRTCPLLLIHLFFIWFSLEPVYDLIANEIPVRIPELFSP